MTLTTVILTEQTPSLAPLLGLIGGKNSYFNLATDSLGKTLREAFLKITNMITVEDETITGEDIAMSVKFDDFGDFQRSLPPTLVTNAEKTLCIRLGNRLVPLKLDGYGDDMEITVGLKKLGAFEEPCVIFSWIDESSEDEDEIILPLAIRMSKETYDSFVTQEGEKKTFSTRKIANMVKKGEWERLACLVLEGRVGGGKLDDIKELPQNTPFKVLDSEPMPTKIGDTFKLTIEHDGEQYSIFSPAKIKNQLLTGYVFTEDSTLEYYLNEKGHIKARATALEYQPEQADDDEMVNLF